MKRKGYFAPVLIAVILLIYYIGMITAFLMIPEIAWWLKAVLCIIPAVLGGVVIHVLVQRIKEINSGENDDLDKY